MPTERMQQILNQEDVYAQQRRDNFAADINNIFAPSVPKNTLVPTVPSFKSTDGEEPWYMKALTGIGATGKVTMNPLSKYFDPNYNNNLPDWLKQGNETLKKSTGAELPAFGFLNGLFKIFQDGYQGQKDAWTDGKIGWGDVPGFGALYGIGKNGESGSDFLGNVGVQNEAAKKWGGLGLDIATDPTTWLTGGMGAATKAGKVAEIAKAQELATDAGFNLGKSTLKSNNIAGNAATDIYDAVKSKYAANPNINQDLAERLAFKKYNQATGAIENAGNEVRSARANDLFAFHVPGTTAVTDGFGVKPAWLQSTPLAAGFVGGHAADEILSGLGIKPENYSSFYKSVYGVDKGSDLSVDALKHLQDNADFIKKPNEIPDMNVKETLNRTFEPNPKFDPNIDPNIHIGGYEEPFNIIDNLVREVSPKESTIDFAKNATKQMPEFVQDATGKSQLGRAMDKVNPFNARAFKSADDLVNHSANYKADATTKIFGRQAETEKKISAIDKAMKNFSEDEKQAVIHTVEGAFPKNATQLSADRMSEVAKVADRVKSLLADIGTNDRGAGTVKSLIQNYFPHVLKPDMEGVLNRPAVQGLLGKSQKNGFGIERKGFKNLAEWKNAIHELESTGNHEDAAALANLFESDPIKALGQRAYKSIRTGAFKGMYDKMAADGLIADKFKSHMGDSFTRVDSATAKALGLKEGQYVHKEVLEGMKDVKDMFTSNGMNRFAKTLNSVNQLFKTVVTTIPSHYINNFIGNVAVTTMVGVKPNDYGKAFSLMREWHKGGMNDTIRQAIDHGVLSQGFVSEFVKSPFADLEKMNVLDKIDNGIKKSVIGKISHWTGDWTDNISRLALYVRGLERYSNNVEKSAADVRKYLFNYTELTSADRNMKVAIPFWNWTKNNIPLMVESFVKHQGFFQGYNKTRNTINSDVKDGNPSYKTEDYLHVPGTDIGLPARLPMNDLSMIGNPLHTFSDLMSRTSPAIKDLIELAMNKQFFNGIPIYKDKGTDNEKAAGIGQYALSQSGALGKLARGAYDDKTTGIDTFLSMILGRPTHYK